MAGDFIESDLIFRNLSLDEIVTVFKFGLTCAISARLSISCYGKQTNVGLIVIGKDFLVELVYFERFYDLLVYDRGQENEKESDKNL